MVVYLLLILGILSRLIIHVPNFSPVIAIAIFGGLYLERKQALWLPIVLMAVTDVMLGWHPTVFFTWGSMLIIACLNFYWREKISVKTLLASSFLSAILFYVVTNFGVWLMTGMYTKNFAGLIQCYAMALPFFRMTLVSAVLYTAVLVGSYELLASRLVVKKAAL